MPFADRFMRWGGIGLAVVLLAAALAGCAPSSPVVPSDIRPPHPRLVAAPKPLPPLPDGAKGNSLMIEAYAQCRLSHADGSDRHLGLIDYVMATRR